MNIFLKGFATGLVLQLAVGPVFFYIVNLSVQRTWMDGLAGVAAVTIVDFLYIVLAVVGIGRLFQNKRAKNALGGFGALVLLAFGARILQGALAGNETTLPETRATSLVSSFASVFALTLLNPMTILFFTGLFSAKAAEEGFSGREVRTFGLGTGTATLVFMGTAAILFSQFGESVPTEAIALLNAAVGCLLVVYGGVRLWVSVKRGAYGKI